ncbi:MAG: hypothetical protein QOD75_3079 [Blastocatellia bacterium]|jgi:hypothetical protein|nr:hypothetical protein [Blastocatellia bacterium]
MNLKDGAIYQLPNGRELVACMTCDNGTVLLSLRASETGIYELNSEGRLLVDGQMTAWQTDDLWETGRVAAPELRSTLAERSMKGREITNERSSSKSY